MPVPHPLPRRPARVRALRPYAGRRRGDRQPGAVSEERGACRAISCGRPIVRWGLLAGAISVEISSTMLLRASNGFSKLVPTIVVLVGYAVSFALLSRVLRAGVPVGVAYAIWSATGTASVAILGRLLFSDPLPLPAVAGIALIIGGVVLVQVAARQA